LGKGDKIMNLKTLPSVAVLMTLLWNTTTFGYKPGPDIIRECPKCKTALEHTTMMSGNTFGARFWTDGKMIAPMLPDRPWLVKCPKCTALFWLDEAKKLGEQRRWDEDKQWPNAVEPSLPTEDDYLRFLGDNNVPKKKELYLRRRVWWATNDAARTNETASVVLSATQEANLEALAKLLNEKDPDQRITKAEILRELRKFDDCISLLTKPFEEEHHAQVAAVIKGLAEQKSWMVKEIKEDKNSNQSSEGPH
jgi:hypothetical protein